MLPLQLLRVRARKETITALFCVADEEIELAKQLIKVFEESWTKKEKKALLDKRLAEVESQHDDYKLVRGFCTLLERRCEFKSLVSKDRRGKEVEPAFLRDALFEESAGRGFALDDFERREIMQAVASKIGISSEDASKIMWSDFDENMEFDGFQTIDVRQLVGWYNLSLMQTLLFNCTKIDFNVSGGTNWKRVLRRVKRLGLMYNLSQRQEQKQQQKQTQGTDGQVEATQDTTQFVCSVDGPLSLFKLTDRYGTTIAKLLPSIVSSEKWSIDAWIIRKTISGRKIYQFKISDAEVPPLLEDPYSFDKGSTNAFDSIVEERFAQRFEQAASGWKLVREPDPLIVSGGRAMVPDFLLERFGKKVYLEIVGFWTKEYLEKKVYKLLDVARINGIDLFVAINEELACSKLFSAMPKERLIFYRGETIPIKSVLNYLKAVDKEIIERGASDPDLKIDIDTGQDVISLGEITRKYNIPPELAVKLGSSVEGYIRAGMYLISAAKANILKPILATVAKFTDACMILSCNGIPESCHSELLSKLGYDVLWQNIDSNTAVIIRRTS